MKRSVRHGIAIAGLAGGFWLLGQAVANAETVPGTNTADSSATLTSNTPGGTGGGSTDSDNHQDVKANNDVDNTAKTGDINAGGGVSAVGVAAGNGNSVDASSGKGAVDAKQNVTTVVWINSQANGGSVSGSNNAAAGNGATNSASAKGTLNSNTTGGSGSHSVGRTDSDNSQHVTANNDVDNRARTGDIDASGGLSLVGVYAGNHNEVDATNGHMVPVWTSLQDSKSKDYYCDEHKNRHEHEHQNGPVNGSQNVDTKVTISSEANGGHVSDSNNAWAGNGGSNSATANGVLNSNTTGGSQSGKDYWDHNKGRNEYDHNHGGSTDSDNHQDVKSNNDVDNTATTGDIDVSGGKSIVDVVAGNGNTLYCTSATGNVTCSQNITTIINIVSEANGGSVSCSNNASAGNAASPVCPVTNNTSNNSNTAPAASPAAHKAVAPAATKSSTTKASTASAGQLAFTGAETSLPLTLGLLALGAGGVLTLAGRRRETATV